MDDRPGFIVPPPGLIPPRPAQDAPPAAPIRPPAPRPDSRQAAAEAAPGRSLPAFLPPVAPAPARTEEQWRLVLPNGHRLPVAGTLLLGRNPSPAAHPGPADPVALDDPTSTVSKTHAAVEVVAGALRVTDLHSTNGVTVATTAGETAATPGEPLDVPAGAELRLGEYRMRAEQA